MSPLCETDDVMVTSLICLTPSIEINTGVNCLDCSDRYNYGEIGSQLLR